MSARCAAWPNSHLPGRAEHRPTTSNPPRSAYTSANSNSQWKNPRRSASSSTSKRVATAYMRDNGMMIVAEDLAANNTASSIYVLWSMASPTDGTPVAIGSFDVAKGNLMSVVSPTGSEPSGRWFAISEEPGRRVPVAPTKIVGAGEAA